MSIAVIDYGLGNVGSICNMLRYISVPYSVESNNLEAISYSDGIILPGVGNFKMAMKILEDSGISNVLKDAVINQQIPILGICLGMQLMCNHSEEGDVKGLGFIDANVTKFKFDTYSNLKIPHMGWSDVIVKKNNILTEDLLDLSRFYFVHSYYVKCKNDEDILMSTNYGHEFTSSFHRDNIFGCQFHPEKSHKYGIQLFKNFSEWCKK